MIIHKIRHVLKFSSDLGLHVAISSGEQLKATENHQRNYKMSRISITLIRE